MSAGSSAHRMPGRPLGVGLIGAGPVTQAIRLPTLATLGDRLRVTHVMDVDPDVAASVAARAATETGAGSGPRRGVRHSTTAAELLADDVVDVVAICSPMPSTPSR
ncbi:hypothetical protein ABZY42_09645 [Streptomyces sp. NPDC006622]|uniref:hypothetical protein n=1 Tax=Streptomyces sp. NPDC006622 TaxID=3155459 RepID=UPI0033A5C18E